MFLHRLPAPYQPDPKDLGFEVHHLAVGEFAGIVLLSAIFWFALIPIRKFFSPDRRLWPLILLFSISWLLILLQVFIDPGDFVEWYFD